MFEVCKYFKRGDIILLDDKERIVLFVIEHKGFLLIALDHDEYFTLTKDTNEKYSVTIQPKNETILLPKLKEIKITAQP